MRSTLLPLLLGATAAVAGAQGTGQGKGKGGGQGKGKGADKAEAVRQDRGNQGRGNQDRGNQGKGRAARSDDDRDNRGRGRGEAQGRSERRIIVSESGGNVSFREFAISPRKGRRLAGLAVATAARSGRDDDFLIMPVDSRVRVLNRAGVVLVDFDDDVELGSWRVVTTPFRDTRDAPSFCRSGAGHPVWGRQWCVDKGFGLGRDDDFRWSRIQDPSGVIIRPSTTGDLTRDVLLDVLGSIVVNRLATHAVTLGLQDPLTGRWLRPVDDTGPRVLLLSSGARPVAEVVDLNLDGNADVMLVAVR